MDQATNVVSFPSTVAAKRAIEKRETRRKNNDAETAHLRMMLSAEYGEATARRYVQAIIQAMTERSEEPLQTLPSLCRERVIEVFHEIQRGRSRKVVPIRPLPG
jgi:hypothetical protein